MTFWTLCRENDDIKGCYKNLLLLFLNRFVCSMSQADGGSLNFEPMLISIKFLLRLTIRHQVLRIFKLEPIVLLSLVKGPYTQQLRPYFCKNKSSLKKARVMTCTKQWLIEARFWSRLLRPLDFWSWRNREDLAIIIFLFFVFTW